MQHFDLNPRLKSTPIHHAFIRSCIFFSSPGPHLHLVPGPPAHRRLRRPLLPHARRGGLRGGGGGHGGRLPPDLQPAHRLLRVRPRRRGRRGRAVRSVRLPAEPAPAPRRLRQRPAPRLLRRLRGRRGRRGPEIRLRRAGRRPWLRPLVVRGRRARRGDRPGDHAQRLHVPRPRAAEDEAGLLPEPLRLLPEVSLLCSERFESASILIFHFRYAAGTAAYGGGYGTYSNGYSRGYSNGLHAAAASGLPRYIWEK